MYGYLNTNMILSRTFRLKLTIRCVFIKYVHIYFKML